MTHKSRRSPSLSRHLLDSSFADVDEWLKLQLTAKEGSWRMFGSLKKKISIRLSSEEKKKSNKNKNALAAVGFCPAMGWRVVHIGRARCHLTLTARTTLSFFSSLANRRKCEKKHISMASWRNLYMKSAERNSTMKDVCMLAQGTSRTTHIANIKRKGVSKE